MEWTMDQDTQDFLEWAMDHIKAAISEGDKVATIGRIDRAIGRLTQARLAIEQSK